MTQRVLFPSLTRTLGAKPHSKPRPPLRPHVHLYTIVLPNVGPLLVYSSHDGRLPRLLPLLRIPLSSFSADSRAGWAVVPLLYSLVRPPNPRRTTTPQSKFHVRHVYIVED